MWNINNTYLKLLKRLWNINNTHHFFNNNTLLLMYYSLKLHKYEMQLSS